MFKRYFDTQRTITQLLNQLKERDQQIRMLNKEMDACRKEWSRVIDAQIAAEKKLETVLLTLAKKVKKDDV